MMGTYAGNGDLGQPGPSKTAFVSISTVSIQWSIVGREVYTNVTTSLYNDTAM